MKTIEHILSSGKKFVMIIVNTYLQDFSQSKVSCSPQTLTNSSQHFKLPLMHSAWEGTWNAGKCLSTFVSRTSAPTPQHLHDTNHTAPTRGSFCSLFVHCNSNLIITKIHFALILFLIHWLRQNFTQEDKITVHAIATCTKICNDLVSRDRMATIMISNE